jgi:hypothetical protein
MLVSYSPPENGQGVWFLTRSRLFSDAAVAAPIAAGRFGHR